MKPGTKFTGTDGADYVVIDPRSGGDGPRPRRGLWRGLEGMCVRLDDGVLVHFSHIVPPDQWDVWTEIDRTEIGS